MATEPDKPAGGPPDIVDRVRNSQRDYEDQRSTVFGRGFEKTTRPIGRMAEALIPPAVMRRALEAADAAAGTYIRTPKHDPNDLAACVEAALSVQKYAMGLNLATGGGLGFFGGTTMMADIPATLTIAARNVRATGLAYGFDGDDEAERLFRLRILELAATGALAQRQKTINEIKEMIEGAHLVMHAARATPILDTVVERVTRTLAASLLGRKAGQVVPVIGAGVAATVNASFQADVGRAARFAYQQRWLAARRMLPAPEADEAL